MGAKMLWALSGIVIAATLQWLGVAAQTDSAEVTVVGTTVTLKCPLDEQTNLEWFKKQKPADSNLQSNEPEYVISEFTDSNNGEYYCKEGASTYHFYIRAKVCQGCIELNTGMVIGIICGDLFFTLLVAVLVYWFAKQRGAAAKDFRPLEPIYPPSRPPATGAAHQSEYAPIKSGQRDVYDKLQRR